LQVPAPDCCHHALRRVPVLLQGSHGRQGQHAPGVQARAPLGAGFQAGAGT